MRYIKLAQNLLVRSALVFLTMLVLVVLPGRAGSSYWGQQEQDEPHSAADNGELASHQTDQIIIKFVDQDEDYENAVGKTKESLQVGRSLSARLSVNAGVNLKYLREMTGGSHVFKLPEKMPIEKVRGLIERLETLGEVDYAVPDEIRYAAYIPNDPDYPKQWHLFAPTTGNFGINAPAAWDYFTGYSANVVVAVIDTGITNHSEFDGRIVPGYDFISDESNGDDDGRDNDPSDPGDGDGVLCKYPSTWHGTHVAGTIGANTNNGIGVSGVSGKAMILPVRVLGRCGGSGYDSDILAGMRWAAGLPIANTPVNLNPAKVLNLSLGGLSSTCPAIWQETIDDVITAGATVVVAAGNDSIDAKSYVPANCNGVITVAATGMVGSKADFSNVGSTIEISAPGISVFSTWNSGKTSPSTEDYTYMKGTSMAAPHVSGVVSMLYSLKPSIKSTEILQILQSTATRFPVNSTCTSTTCGAGIVNAGAAVATLGIGTNQSYSYLHLPIIKNNVPTPPAIELTNVYVNNQTWGTLCYDVFDSGIGEKCFDEGKNFYGSFKSGTYLLKASGCGSSMLKTINYEPGSIEHSFSCTGVSSFNEVVIDQRTDE